MKKVANLKYMMDLHGELLPMKKLKNLTEEDVLKKINLVISKIAPRYTFSGYELEDIKQEAFIICMDALDRYDEKRPLENFLSVHLSNRLKNFIRDNFYLKDDQEKKKVLMPTNILNEDLCHDPCDTPELFATMQEFKDKIDANIPSSMRSDYLKMLDGIYITKNRKQEIIDFIKDILHEER
jgi:RNA polymerase sigma factor (sigma-70 family)